MLNDPNIEFSRDEVSRYYEVRVPDLNQRGRQWRCACPIHHGTGDNFAVDPYSGLWKCHSTCGTGGDILSLEMRLNNSDFKTAKADVFQIVGRIETETRRNRIHGKRDRLASSVPDQRHSRPANGARLNGIHTTTRRALSFTK
jgi:DNA primase